MNNTPIGERACIALFGRCNVGKSSLINSITSEDVAIVSDIRGTTTDPVKKTMELLPFGPVLIIDTPGLDDDGSLGRLRIQRSLEYIKQTDLILLVTDAEVGIQKEDKVFLDEVKKAGKKFLIVGNKCDCTSEVNTEDIDIYVSAVTGEGIDKLKNLMAEVLGEDKKEKTILGNIVKSGDIVLLVTPIDVSAPKGRLILPQQQVIREILDRHAIAITVQVEETETVSDRLKDNITLVICDSQVFNKVSKIVPENISLTSFSILFANYKGSLKSLFEGAQTLSKLKAGDKILISEGCTHHRQCEDIGTVKLPRWIKEFAGKNNLKFEFTSGGDFGKNLKEYKLIVHCGGCMLNQNQMHSRMMYAEECGIPMTNYGMAIAYMNGILGKAVQVIKDKY